MANVDPSTFTTAAQIFSPNHNLPQIRSIHKALHVQIEEKSSRLRTQVGDSYRELLGTADTIVHMRGDNDLVQGLLGKMGGRCGRAVIGAKATGLANFVTGQNRSDAALAAKLRLLDACLLVVSRILKGGGGLGAGLKKGDRLVLATKVWVLARLLIKDLGDAATDETSQRAMRTTKNTLDNLRRRLIKSEDTDREDVLKALCAYSLTTSSGARDVLRHFLSTRAEAIALAFEVDESEREKRSTEDVIRGLKLYTKTLLDVQALVPGKLSVALGGLKKYPLLADKAMKDLAGLRLDVYERWCGEEIQYFTPYIRHDDFDGKQAREMLMGWSEKGTSVLLDGLKKTLEQMLEFKVIMELRTQVLQLWIRDGGKIKGIDPSEMQDELRDAINIRMLAVLDIKVSKLRLVGSEIAATLGRWKDGITDDHQSLWSDEGYDEALSNGAGPFVQEVVSRLYGRNDAVSKAAHSYKSWYHVIDDVKEVVESLRRQRWDNDYDEIEDEETIEARQQLLSKDDPQMLQERLDTTLDKSFEELEEQIQEQWEERASAANNGKVAMYFLRVLRDIRHQLPQREAIQNFGLSMVPALHSKIAIFVSMSALKEFAESELAMRTVVGRLLWEGEPSLPNQPSPEVFQFLRTLSLAMEDMGEDLWTVAAAKTMKEHLSKQLCGMWVEAVKELAAELSGKKPAVFKETSKEPEKVGEKKGKSGEEEGMEKPDDDDSDEDDEKDEKDDEPKQNEAVPNESTSGLTQEWISDLLKQWLFDVALLRRCIGNASKSAGNEFKLLEDAVYQHTKLDSDQARERVAKGANDFWNRTSLLFSILA